MAVDPARAKSLFLNASDLADPAERADYLERECGADAELRARVEALLRANDDSPVPPLGTDDATIDSDAGRPATKATGVHTPSPDTDPAPISLTAEYRGHAEPNVLIAGRYTLQEKIGEGGMGEVWVARQSEPVKRKVALKLIKPGMDSRAVLQRFEQERQALALMDHPCIARVLDAGMTPNGQPFFVMELVNGLPLNKFCDELKLTPKERLELFVPICQAVQHAHQKGIVHRDLKPANILVTMIDGKPVPKVIDFGVAKATAGKLTDESMSTMLGAVVGTLEYMSPEQAGFTGEDIDTRADIYSLGVILYELLTGLRPIDATRLKQAALTEMIRIIREEEPSKPSTRLSTDASLPSTAALRQIEPRKLMALLRGDLDWVVMKCLEKQRDRRYETANAVARDVQRYLGGEAVEACPPSVGYRLGKFLGRHKGPALAASLVFLALVAGIVGTSWGLVRADRARRAEASQRIRAEASEEQAIAAVKRFRDAVADNPGLKNNPGLETLRRALLREPLEFFRGLRDRLQGDRDTRPESLARLAAAAFELGTLAEEIGDKRDALRAFEESREIRERLARQNPAVTEFASDLANSHNNIGVLQSETGHPEAALDSFSRALAIRERLARENPTDAQFASRLAASHNNIGLLQSATGHPDAALESYGRALEIQQRLARENPTVTRFASDLAASHNNIGLLQSATGHPDAALESYGRALEIFERLARENPTVTDFASALAMSHNNIGILQSETGHPEAALESYGRALEIFERLARQNPAVTEFASDLANSHNNIGVLQSETGHPEAALDSFSRALAIRERLARENPTDAQFATRLADSHNDIGKLQGETGHPEAALDSFSRALAIRERLARENPTVTRFASDLAISHNNIGVLQSETGHPEAALESYGRSLEIQQRLARENPTVTEFASRLAGILANIGNLQSETGHPGAALESLGRALEIQQRLARENPTVTDFASTLGLTLNNMAVIEIAAGRHADARDRLRQAIAWQKQALASNPNHPTYRRFLRYHYSSLLKASQGLDGPALAAEVEQWLEAEQLLVDDNPTTQSRDTLAGWHEMFGEYLSSTGKLAEAEAEFRAAIALRRALAEEEPTNTNHQSTLAGSIWGLGTLLWNAGRSAGAEAAWRENLAIQLKLADDNPANPRFRFDAAGAHLYLGRELSRYGRTDEAEAEVRLALGILQPLVDAEPGSGEFARRLALGRLTLGSLLARTGMPPQAEAEARKALTLCRKLANDNPKDFESRNLVASALNDLGDLARRSGRPAEARDHYEEAIVVRRGLVQEAPQAPTYRGDLAASHRRLGLARSDLGDSAGTATESRKALELFESLPSPGAEPLFEAACCHAALSGLAGKPGVGLLDGEEEAEADQAMGLLRKAADLGYRDPRLYRDESALDPLRDREDLKTLVAELEKTSPAEPAKMP